MRKLKDYLEYTTDGDTGMSDILQFKKDIIEELKNFDVSDIKKDNDIAEKKDEKVTVLISSAKLKVHWIKP